MLKSVRYTLAGVIALAGATQLVAGGLFVMLGNPDASPEAKARKAVVTLKLAGCHEPEKATVSATAVGIVDGRRTTIPIKAEPLSERGMYSVARQWPEKGRWVLQFVARDDGRMTSTIVAAGPEGVDRGTAKMAMAEPSQSEIAALLAGSGPEVARK
jgi:hypothetical protein